MLPPAPAAQRVITSPPAREAVLGTALPWHLRAGRAVLLVLLFAIFFYLISLGTMEGRITYVLAFLAAFINPLWGFFAYVLVAPLALLDQSKTHMLAFLEVVTIGIIAGELRLAGRVRPDDPPRVFWGIWPHYLAGLMLVLLGSAMVGIQLLLLAEYPMGRLAPPLQLFGAMTFWGPPTDPHWTIKCLWNWGTGMVVAVCAARRMDALAVARWLKFGAIVLVVTCAFALLDWLGVLPLSHIRQANPDPLHAGRLQGTAGHAGWFAQLIVVLWPGLLLWWSTGRTRRNAVMAGVLLLVALTLFLTGARASWLAFGAAVGVAGVLAARQHPEWRRILVVAGVVAALVLVVGGILGSEAIVRRLTNPIRFSDRANYYISGLVFLREHPFGIGLGTHYRFYEWTFTPFWTWYQSDHVTAHSMWLQVLIENGPIALLMVVGAVGAVGVETLRSWRLLDADARRASSALLVALVGLLVVCFAQDINYIRIIELLTWAIAGALVGLARQARCRTTEEVESWQGRRILLAAGVCTLLAASVNASRNYAGNVPRLLEPDPTGNGLTFWTGAEWRTPVPESAERVRFSLHRKALPGHGRITWPDGTTETFTLAPDEWRYFEFTQQPAADHWSAAPRWLRLEVTPLWTPKADDPAAIDERALGFYVANFHIDRPAAP